MALYFYAASDRPYGCFSNFSLHGFQLDGHWWPTCEHYYQAHKHWGTAQFDQVRQAETPAEAKLRGRDPDCPCRADWDQVKDEVMERAVLEKFKMHPEIRQQLLETGDELLVENSPVDYYWGCGEDGSGKNRLGEILMAVRSHLRQTKADQDDLSPETFGG